MTKPETDHKDLDQLLLESTPDRIWIVSRDLTFMHGNRTFREHFRKITGKAARYGDDIFPKGIPAEMEVLWRNLYKKVLDTGQVLWEEVKSTACPDGKCFEYTLSPVYDEWSQIYAILVSGRDISQRLRLEESLRASNHFLKTTQKLANVGGWEWDILKQTMTWTDETYRIHDLEPENFHHQGEELINTSITCYHPDDRIRIKNAFDACCNQGIPYDLELQMTTTKGRNILVRTVGEPVFTDGKPVKVTGHIIDITAQKENEDALKYSEMKFRAITQQASEMLYLHDLQGNLIEVNQAAVDRTGYSTDEILKLTVFDIDPDAEGRLDRDNIWNTLSQLESKTFESVHRAKNGEIYPVEISVGKVAFGNTEYVLATVRDITERKKAEALAREKQATYHALFEQSLSIKLLMNPDNASIVDANPAAALFYGYTVEDLKEMAAPDIFQPGGIELELWIENIRTGNETCCEMKHRLADGSLRDVEVCASLIRISGNILLHVIIQDITRRRQAEDALKNSEQHARALVAAIPDMIFTMNADGVFLDYKADEDSLYTQPELFIGRNIASVMPEWFAKLTREKIIETLDSGKLQVFEYSLEIPEKGLCHYECRMAPYAIDSVLAIVRDITERKLSEQEIKEREANARAIMEATDDIFILLDKNGMVIDCNEAHARRLNTSRKELIGSNVSKYLPEDILKQRLKLVNQAIDTGFPVFSEDFRGGFWNEFAIYPIFIDGRQTENVAVFSKDVTEKKEFIRLLETKNRELQESEERFRRIFEESPVGIALVRENFIFSRVNGRFLEMLGYSTEELKTMTFRDLTHPAHLQADMEGMKNLLAGKIGMYHTEKRYICRDGRVIWAIANVSVIRHKDGRFQAFLAAIEDITLKKASEEMVSASEEKYRTLFEYLTQGVFYQAQNGKITDANDATTKMLGLSREQLLGKDSFDRRWKVVDEDYRLLSPEEHPSMQALITGEPVINKTVGVYIPEKEAYHWLIINAIPQFSKGGEKPYQVFASMQDITYRKAAEEALRESEARLQDLNATKDKFFSIIAHDLISPFNSIIGFSELLTSEARSLDVATISQYAGIIHHSGNQALLLLQNLLDWARIQQGRFTFSPRNILLREIASEAVSVVSAAAAQKKILVTNHVSPKCIVSADENMIRTLIRNLVSNAVKFTGQGGRIEISDKTDGNFIQVSVSDTGVGIPKTEIKKLFNIGTTYTTRGTDNEKGTGLGLILCREFAEKHGGAIWAESTEGKGSTFHFTIPAAIED